MQSNAEGQHLPFRAPTTTLLSSWFAIAKSAVQVAINNNRRMPATNPP
jgi:hypothetical protein